MIIKIFFFFFFFFFAKSTFKYFKDAYRNATLTGLKKKKKKCKGLNSDHLRSTDPKCLWNLVHHNLRIT